MTNPDLSLIAALLDRSGSMQSIADDMRGGFDSFIEGERAAAGATEVTLAQFDHEYQTVYQNRPIADVPPLVLQPRGRTALLDSMGRFITELGADLAARPEQERPDDVTVVVMTDGMENASLEWGKDAVRALITQQENDYDWTFMFLGANMDAVAVGTDLGFAQHHSLTYQASPAGVVGAFVTLGSVRQKKRSAPRGTKRDIGFDEEERKRANPADAK